MYHFVGSRYHGIGACVTDSSSVKKALWCIGVHSNFAFWQVKSVNGMAILAKFLINFLQYPMSPRKEHTCLAVLGGCMLFIAWVFDGRGLIPLVLRIHLRYWISLVKKWHLPSLTDKCAFLNFSKTCWMWLRLRFGMDDLSHGIWWYPACRSNVDKYFAPFNWEKISSTFGMSQINFLVTLLSTWKSMTRHFPPSPYGTTMMGADQLDWLPCITFAIRSSFILSLTHWLFFIAIGYGFCDTGSEVPVSIVISVRGVVPIEVSSCINWESYSFNNVVSLVSTCCFNLWWGGLKVSSSSFSNVILWVVILWTVGVSVVWGISSMVGSRWPTYSPLLKAMCLLVLFDKVCHMSCNYMFFDFDWDNTIMSRRYFESWLDNAYYHLLFTVLSISEEPAILLYVAVLFLIPVILPGKHFVYQFQIVFLCLVACNI